MLKYERWNGQKIREEEKAYIKWFKESHLSGDGALVFYSKYGLDINQIDNIKEYPGEWQALYLDKFMPLDTCKCETLVEPGQSWMNLRFESIKRPYPVSLISTDQLCLKIVRRGEQEEFRFRFTILDWDFYVDMEDSEIVFRYKIQEIESDWLVLTFNLPKEFLDYL